VLCVYIVAKGDILIRCGVKGDTKKCKRGTQKKRNVTKEHQPQRGVGKKQFKKKIKDGQEYLRKEIRPQKRVGGRSQQRGMLVHCMCERVSVSE
jgi:hypothetical protein